MRHGLSRSAARHHQGPEPLAGILAFHHGESVLPGGAVEAADDLLLARAVPGPEHHGSALERLAGVGVAEERRELLSRCLHDQGRVGDQQQCAGPLISGPRRYHVGAGLEGRLEADPFPALRVVALDVQRLRPRAKRPASAEASPFDPIACVARLPEVQGVVQLNRVKLEVHLLEISGGQLELDLRSGQEDVRHHHRKPRRGDLLDRPPGLPPVTRLTLVELRDEAAVELERPVEVGPVARTPALVDHGSSVAV